MREVLEPRSYAPRASASGSILTFTTNLSPPEERFMLVVSRASTKNGISTPKMPWPASSPGPNAIEFLADVLAKYWNLTVFTVHPSPEMDTLTSTSMAPKFSKLGVLHFNVVRSTNSPATVAVVLPSPKRTSILELWRNLMPFTVISVSPNTYARQRTIQTR